MKYGAGAVNSLLIDDPTAMRDVAQAADGLGYDFLTLIDHVLLAYPAPEGTARSHYPAQTPYHDILVSLGYLAGVTSRIALRSAVVILPQRGPGGRGQAGGRRRCPVRRAGGTRARDRVAPGGIRRPGGTLRRARPANG